MIRPYKGLALLKTKVQKYAKGAAKIAPSLRKVAKISRAADMNKALRTWAALEKKKLKLEKDAE